EGHVANDFAGWSHFHDIAEKLIHLGKGLLDFMPAMAETKRDGLFAKIGVLPAGDFMVVQSRGARSGAGVEWPVVGANCFPIVGAFVEGMEIQTSIARSVFERRNNGIQIGLACATAHGGNRAVGYVYPRFTRLQYRGRVDSTGVVGMKMNRQI